MCFRKRVTKAQRKRKKKDLKRNITQHTHKNKISIILSLSECKLLRIRKQLRKV